MWLGGEEGVGEGQGQGGSVLVALGGDGVEVGVGLAGSLAAEEADALPVQLPHLKRKAPILPLLFNLRIILERGKGWCTSWI